MGGERERVQGNRNERGCEKTGVAACTKGGFRYQVIYPVTKAHTFGTTLIAPVGEPDWSSFSTGTESSFSSSDLFLGNRTWDNFCIIQLHPELPSSALGIRPLYACLLCLDYYQLCILWFLLLLNAFNSFSWIKKTPNCFINKNLLLLLRILQFFEIVYTVDTQTLSGPGQLDRQLVRAEHTVRANVHAQTTGPFTDSTC
jgi:hypothetical protein